MHEMSSKPQVRMCVYVTRNPPPSAPCFVIEHLSCCVDKKLTEVIPELRSIQDSVRNGGNVSRLFGGGWGRNLAVEDFQVILITCKLEQKL